MSDHVADLIKQREKNLLVAKNWARRRKDELEGRRGMPAVCFGCGGPRDMAGSFYCRPCRRPVREVSGE